MKCARVISYGQQNSPAGRTIVEVSSQFVVGAPLDHFSDVLCLLIDRHGSDDAAMWRRGGQLDLDWTGFGNLTIELLQQGRVLGRKGKRRRIVMHGPC